MEPKVQNLIDECKRIEEDSTYTAEVHHLIVHKLSKRAFWYKLIPAGVTVLSALVLLFGAPIWTSWITLLSGLITIINILMEPEKKAKEHLFAAKNFTVLKHEARSLYETFRNFIGENDFYHETKRLREKYNWLVQITPSTDDKKCWEEARKRIKEGVHKPDFKTNKNKEENNA